MRDLGGNLCRLLQDGRSLLLMEENSLRLHRKTEAGHLYRVQLRLPPIRPEEADLLFHRQDLRGDQGDFSRADSRMSINSPETDSLRSANTGSHLPSIESDREDSARYSQQIVG